MRDFHNSKTQDKSYHHNLMLCFGVFLLLQGLIAKNLEEWPLLFQSVKYVDEAVTVLAFLFLIAIPWLTKGQRPQKTGIEWLLSLFLLIGIISSIAAQVPLFIIASQFLLYIKGFLLFYIFANLSMNIMILRKYIRFFLYCALVFLFFGFIDIAAPDWFRTVTGNVTNISYREGIPSVISLFIHPGQFGWFMSFIALYWLAFYLVFHRPSYLFGGLVFSLGCLFSMRAKPLGGLVAGILAGLTTLPLTKRIEKGLVIAVIGICISVPVLPKLYGLYQSRVTEYIEVRDPMLIARNALYITSIDIGKDYFPFGAGFGRYGSWISRKHYSPIYDGYELSRVYGLSRETPRAINDTFWPMVLGETGFIGLALYAWILISFVKTLYRQVRSESDKYVKAFQLGTLMVLIESLVESIAESAYVGPPMVYFIFGSIGICYSLNEASRHAPRKELIKYA